MSDEVREVLVLTDEAGDYYVLPREVIESYKVAQEYREELSDLLQPDTTGFSGRISPQPQPFSLAGALRLQGFFGARTAGIRAFGVRAFGVRAARPE
jgi:hypothetical protein